MKTKSLCPVCLKVIDIEIIKNGKKYGICPDSNCHKWKKLVHNLEFCEKIEKKFSRDL